MSHVTTADRGALPYSDTEPTPFAANSAVSSVFPYVRAHTWPRYHTFVLPAVLRSRLLCMGLLRETTLIWVGRDFARATYALL